MRVDDYSPSTSSSLDQPFHENTVDSPLGPITLRSQAQSLVGLFFADHKHRRAAVEASFESCAVLQMAAAQLQEYFAGRRQRFDLPLTLRGTRFQQEVWATLTTIEYGQRISYAELARRVQRPTAFRAVGAANGRNPISIIVPCHRVVASSGALTGFGGGVELKQWLLDHEAKHALTFSRSASSTCSTARRCSRLGVSRLLDNRLQR